MDEARTSEACRMGDLVSGFVDRLEPGAAASTIRWPRRGRICCRATCVPTAGSRASATAALKVLADGSSYLFELQLCKAVLLRELQRLCPSAKIRRIDVACCVDERLCLPPTYKIR